MVYPWWLVILFIIHDGEEVIFLPSWVRTNAEVFTGIEKRLPWTGRLLHLIHSSDQKQFGISVFILLILLCAICGLAAAFPEIIWIQDVFLGSVIIYTIHLVIHALQSLYIGKAVPGVISSVAIFIPMVILWQNTINSRNISFIGSLLYGFIAVLVFLPAFPLILKLGQWLGKRSAS
jgi:hypothetical protein